MKLLTIKNLIATLATSVALAAMAALFWISTTTDGARWLLTSALPLSGISFSAHKIDGSLCDHLQLSGVQTGLGQLNIELGTLDLRWKPLLVMTGTVGIQQLTVTDLNIQDNTPPDNTPLNLAWPKLSGNAQLLDVTIARLQISNISYRRLQQQALLVNSLAGSVTWQDGLLSVNELKLITPDGQATGNLAAGFNQPSFTSDLTIILKKPVAEMDRFSLQIRQAQGPEQFVGKVSVSGSLGNRKLLELQGELGMAPHALNLRKLQLNRSGKKGTLTADGSLAFTSGESLMNVNITVAGLDLAPELNVPTDLSGTLTFAGTLDSYRGDFKLANRSRGWQAATAVATYSGTRDGVKLAPFNATLLDGSLTGNMDLTWLTGTALRAVLRGKNLNPARLDPAWKGVANFTADGKLNWSETAALAGTVRASLLESRLHGQALTGKVQADFANSSVLLSRLVLQGKGFDLHASGDLKQRIALAAHITDFSRLMPGSTGKLLADGWLRWKDRQLTGVLTGSGSRLAYAGIRIATANLNARLEQGAGYPLHVNADLQNVVYDAYKLSGVTLEVDGTLPQHTVKTVIRSGSNDARATLVAGYNNGIWKGSITRLAGSDHSGAWNMSAPTAFSASSTRVTLAPLALAAGASERLTAAVDMNMNPMLGKITADWSALNMNRVTPWLKDARLTGTSSGKIRIGILPGSQLTMTGSASASGSFSGPSGSVTVRQSMLTFDGTRQGSQLGIDLTMADNGRVKGSFRSASPLRLALPEKGDLTVELSNIDLALLKAWLTTDTQLMGRISGRASGKLLPGQRFELVGTAQLPVGTVQQQRPEGELKLDFTSAQATWAWRGEALSGNLDLVMTRYGQARGTFQLPLAARFPLVINQKGLLRGTLVATVQEKGIITTLFPGLVQESSGDVAAELAISGSWEAPQIGGKLQLSKAGAYLPTAGIHLREVQLAARLEKDLIRIDSFRALFGSGHIEGSAQITLDRWQVARYQGTLNGENFQSVFFPELLLLSAPKLSFEGTPQKLTVRGDVVLPELRIVGTSSRSAVTPSSDVIREGQSVTVVKSSAPALDVKVRILLGDKVFVKTSGIDAQLGGGVDLSFSALDRITSTGEINVVKGRYRTYGVNLEIVRGRLFFAGGTIDRPSLDVLALRTIGTVRAGVIVSGTLQRPVTRLYSEPAMPDVDVLAYIVLGHPLGSSGQQTTLLTQAAGALLTSGQAAQLQEKIKNRFGLSTLEIQGGVGAGSGSMGYTPLQVTAPGTIPAEQQPGITETVLTVGKFLTPQLYISYGKSLFTGSNLFRLRYDFFKQWQIETQTGSGESGADLYYKMEFK